MILSNTPTPMLASLAIAEAMLRRLRTAAKGGLCLPARGREKKVDARYTSFTFFSGRLRTGLPVAAKIAFITEGATTQIVGSPMPPQKS